VTGEDNLPLLITGSSLVSNIHRSESASTEERLEDLWIPSQRLEQPNCIDVGAGQAAQICDRFLIRRRRTPGLREWQPAEQMSEPG
jgi:hypothetical protein